MTREEILSKFPITVDMRVDGWEDVIRDAMRFLKVDIVEDMIANATRKALYAETPSDLLDQLFRWSRDGNKRTVTFWNALDNALWCLVEHEQPIPLIYKREDVSLVTRTLTL